MSTPQTLTQTLPPHQHLDHRQRASGYLPSPADRYLPPPRPSSNLSNGYHHNIPTRPSSNLSSRQLPPPPRPASGMSNGAYSHAHSQSRAGEYGYSNGITQQLPHDDLRRTESRSAQQLQQRQLPPPPPQHHHSASTSRAPAAVDMPATYHNHAQHSDSAERGRKRNKSPVDWVAFFGGKPPAEIIEIHDDDSPAPPATIQRPQQPPTANGSSSSGHVDKKRRVHGGSGEVAAYSNSNTPYTYSNGASTESLQATTAPTSLASQASTSSKYDTAQTGQKRKRTTRGSDAALKKQESERSGPKGYLAEYGEYVPPPRQAKKQKDVVVPAIHDVCLPCQASPGLRV